MHKDPVEQARTAMFKIKNQYRESTGQEFPGKFRFALCFPESRTISGRLPNDLKPESIWTTEHLANLPTTISRLLGLEALIKGLPNPAMLQLNKILAPKCNIFASLEDKIISFQHKASFILTEEQSRILEETEEDKRKLFLGAAGTGKSYIAMEKARRCASEGKRVLLTCYNKHLVGWLQENISNPLVTTNHFHGYLIELLKGEGLLLPEEILEESDFYNNVLPDKGFNFYADVPEERKFDVIIIDEGQDFQEHWLLCLETMLKQEGELYIFADPNQDLFNGGLKELRNRYNISKHKLSNNLRNADTINKWLLPYSGNTSIRSKLTNGVPVTPISYKDQLEEKRLIEKEIGRLVSQGLPLNRILILSPYRLEKGCLQGTTRIKEWPIVDFKTKGHGIRYATIRSFKGLEADVVFLIDIKDSKACTPADVYVGASRARYMLYVFHHEDWTSL